MSTLGVQALEREIPHLQSYPIVGSTFHWLRDMDGFFEQLYRENYPVMSFSLTGRKRCLLMGPDANELVLLNRDGIFESEIWKETLNPFFRRGLISLDGAEHKTHRRALQSAFTQQAMKGYCEMMQPQIKADVRAWEAGRPLFLYDELKDLTLNMACEVFVGTSVKENVKEINKAFLDCVHAVASIVRLNLPGTMWRAGLKSRAVLEKYFEQLLPERRSNPGEDLLSRLCFAEDEKGERYNDEEVINHIIFVMMAAHDTSTITLANLVYFLAKHPEWQDKCRKECQALGKEQLEYSDLNDLNVLDRVIKETLRMVAPLPIMMRACVRDFEFGGYHIPAGTQLAVSPWQTHFMEEYWSNPRTFDPDRFAEPRNEHKKHPYQWIPFGGGAHKCIGLHFGMMEIKSVLFHMLLNYQWSVPEGYEMKQDYTSMPIPKDRLPMTLQPL